GKPPDRLSDIRKTLPKDASEGIVEVAGPASSAPFVTFSGGALAATEVEGMQNGPLLVGDALIQTPPRFGDGLRHIRGQVGILESHLEKDSFDPPACAGDLADYAAAVWDGLILTLGLEQQGLHGDRE
ncbi:MAG: hypothetical protein GWM87_01315, partial [Xanthomonadales bacterium]|nr:hypothetical protein [Xanthomonadales bacterium]NIX11726.1 hypothetical protein [Xanthomonadales bacterium]